MVEKELVRVRIDAFVAGVPDQQRTDGKKDVLLELIKMGPAIFPQLFLLARETEAGEMSVYAALEEAGRLYWEQVEQGNEYLTQAIIEKLAEYPDDVFDLLLYVLSHPLKEWWEIAVLVFAAMGYPRNATAISALIWTATDPNSPGAREALDYLGTLEVQVVASAFIAALLTEENGGPYPDWATICALLGVMDRRYLLPCGPAFVYVLVAKRPLAICQQRTLLSRLETIGPKCAPYALPALIDLMQQEQGTNTGVRIRNFVYTFDQQALTPYRKMLDAMNFFAG